MGKRDSLTISILRQGRCRSAARLGGYLAILGLVLAACTIEVGPPPESDPPLVSESERLPPPPPQPTEPQPWSRDLNFEEGPTRIDRDFLAEGLVADEAQGTYSRERLTYESAFEADKPPSEAELARQRARARAEAAGLPPPPEVAAAPVASVSEQSLSPTGDATAPQRRQSRLPPPPKFPPLPPKDAEAVEAGATESPAAAPAVAEAAPAPPGQRPSRLPPPPKFPPLPAEAPAAEVPAPEVPAREVPAREVAVPEATAPEPAVAATAPVAASPAAAEQLAAASEPPAATEPEVPVATDAQTAAFLAEAWDAPAGTILVQVSAVQDKTSVLDEWARLRARYPQVLTPLRLVIDEAKLGDRGVFYRVQAGAFGTPEGATAACDSLISQGQACFVVVR